MRYINGVSEEDINDKSLWVVKYTNGCRQVMSGSELNETIKVEDFDNIRDIDWLSFEMQPKELKPFFDWYEKNRYKIPYIIYEIFKEYGEEK